MESIGFSLLGLAFFEALRAYRCITQGNSIVPKIGFGIFGAAVTYSLVIVIFALVSIFMTKYIGDGSAVQSFLFGFAIPSGAGMLNRSTQKSIELDEVDDMASQRENRNYTSFLRSWFARFYA